MQFITNIIARQQYLVNQSVEKDLNGFVNIYLYTLVCDNMNSPPSRALVTPSTNCLDNYFHLANHMLELKLPDHWVHVEHSATENFFLVHNVIQHRQDVLLFYYHVSTFNTVWISDVIFPKLGG